MKRFVALAALAACKAQPGSGGAATTVAEQPPGATITVSASLPGATASEIATTIAAPLERQFGQIAKLDRLTSRSRLGATTVRLEFAAGVSSDDAARAVQQAINAAANLLPRTMPTPPTYSKSGQDLPVLRVALASDVLPLDDVGVQADSIVAQKLSQVAGVGLVTQCGAPRDEYRVEVDAIALAGMNKTLDDVLDEIRTPPKLGSADTGFTPGSLVREVASVSHGGGRTECVAFDDGKRAVVVTVQPQPLADRAETRARLESLLPAIQQQLPAAIRVHALPDADDAYELTGEPDRAFARLVDDARSVAAHAALVELGVDLDGEPAPETISVHAVGGRDAITRAATERQLAVREPGDRVVGLSSADAHALHDALSQLVAALRTTSLPVHGTLGDDETSTLEPVFDRDRMAALGVTEVALAQTMRGLDPAGIYAGAIYGQLAITPIVVTVRDPALGHLYVRASTGSLVPLDAFVTLRRVAGPAVVLHDGQFPWVGVRVAGTRAELDAALARIPVPAGVRRSVR